ncbi:MAG: hypothetical protein AAFO94_21610 [Bacteroidota bacterium]
MTMLHSAFRLLPFLLLLCCMACQQDTTPALKPLNLLEHGVPITIMAPDSAEVKASDIMGLKDITVKKDDFAIQIFSSNANTTSVAKVLEGQKDIVKELSSFSKMVKEEEDAFIFETVIDTLKSHDFRHVQIKGDKEYIFQTGYLGDYDLEKVEFLLNAVRPSPAQ